VSDNFFLKKKKEKRKEERSTNLARIIQFYVSADSCPVVWKFGKQEVYIISRTISMYNLYQHRSALIKITKDLMVQNTLKESYNLISSLSF